MDPLSDFYRLAQDLIRMAQLHHFLSQPRHLLTLYRG
jgi:hypothetical protein